MSHQPQLIPDQPAPDQAARQAERVEYLERLRETRKAPEFRAIEGFPIDDEHTMALSDPSYCPICLRATQPKMDGNRVWVLEPSAVLAAHLPQMRENLYGE